MAAICMLAAARTGADGLELIIAGNAVAVTRDNPLDGWDDAGVVVVGLTKVTAEGFLSSDGKNRELEGVLAFGVNGQETAVEWTAPAKGGDVACAPTLIYAGRANHLDKDGAPIAGEKVRLELGCEMIESDEDSRKRLGKWSGGLQAAGGFASLVPGYGAPISAGIGLARSVLNVIKKRQDDDTELAVRSTILPDCGEIQIVRKRKLLTLTLKVHHLHPSGKERKGALRVKSVRFQIDEDGHKIRPGRFLLMFEVICGAGKQRRHFSFQHMLDRDDRGVGDGAGTIEGHFSSVREMAGMEAFRGDLQFGVPIRFSARILKADDRVEAISAVAGESGTFAAEVLPAGAAAVATKISKAETTFRTFVLPLLAGKEDFDLGTFDGYLFEGASDGGSYLLSIPAEGELMQLTSKGRGGRVVMELEVIA